MYYHTSWKVNVKVKSEKFGDTAAKILRHSQGIAVLHGAKAKTAILLELII